MYTMNIATRSIETRVVGVTFENRQAVVAILSEGERVSLIREPDIHSITMQSRLSGGTVNKLVIWTETGEKIGSIDGLLWRSIVATVKRLMGGSYQVQASG